LKWRLVTNNIATHSEIETSYTYEDMLEAIIMIEYKEAYLYTQSEDWEEL